MAFREVIKILITISISGCDLQNQSNTKSTFSTKQEKSDVLDSIDTTGNKKKLESRFQEVSVFRDSFVKTSNNKWLELIEKEANKSDGILTTEISLILVEIFDFNPTLIIRYLKLKNNLRFRQLLINGWSEILSVYNGEERKIELNKFKKEKLMLITKPEKEYLTKMLEEIRPNMYD